jgi:hypothetical protein
MDIKFCFQLTDDGHCEVYFANPRTPCNIRNFDNLLFAHQYFNSSLFCHLEGLLFLALLKVCPGNITCFNELNGNINDVCHFQMAVLAASVWATDSLYPPE